MPQVRSKALCAFLGMLLVVMGCRRAEQPTPEAPAVQLPPETTIGARTAAALVNGQAWMAQSPIFQYAVSASIDQIEDILYLEINCHVRDSASGILTSNQFLVFNVKGVTGPGRYPIQPEVNYPEGVIYYGGLFRDKIARCDYILRTSDQGYLEVTHFDAQRQIISGRFTTTLSGPCGPVQIARGQFDTTFDPSWPELEGLAHAPQP